MDGANRLKCGARPYPYLPPGTCRHAAAFLNATKRLVGVGGVDSQTVEATADIAQGLEGMDWDDDPHPVLTPFLRGP